MRLEVFCPHMITNLNKVRALMFVRSMLAAVLLIFSGTSNSFGWWFGNQNYYEIKTKDDFYYAIGEPEKDGEYTVFKKWPENLDWRIKTNLIILIKDIGNLSPDEQKNKQLKAIFKETLKLRPDLLNSKKLAEARAAGYSDLEIYDYLRKSDAAFSDAFYAGFSLEKICDFLEKEKANSSSNK